MNGWKTYTAGALAMAYGILSIFQGGDMTAAIQSIIGGLGLIGVGHKLDKNTQAILDSKE